MSLLIRLLLSLSVIGGLGIWLLVSQVVKDLRPRYLESMEASMVDMATILASNVERHVSDAGMPIDDMRDTFRRAAQRSFSAKIWAATKTRVETWVYITDKSGAVIFDSREGQDEGKDYSRWINVSRTLHGTYGARSTRSDPDDPATSVLHVSAPIMHAGEIAGVLTVCKPSNSVSVFIDEAKAKLRSATVWLCATLAVMGLGISFWITRPIASLRRYVERLQQGQSANPPSSGPHEIVALGNAFDAMVQTIEGRRYAERHLQSLIHEMKSPLSSIKGAAELLREPMDRLQRADFLKTILIEVDRLNDLVQRQLQLAALEARRDTVSVERIQVREVIEDVVVAFDPMLRAKGLKVESSGALGSVIQGERFLIRQAFANLLQNAIDFSPAGAAIGLTASTGGGVFELAIRDQGPGVPEYAKEHVFDRFFSLPRPDTGMKGTGLGLNFVQEIARLHGGEVLMGNAEGGGALVRFRMPEGRALSKPA